MFTVVPAVLGLLVGLATGGRLERLGTIRVRWGWAVIAGLATQVVLFSGVVRPPGMLGPLLYVASTGLVFLAVLANGRIAGAPIIAAGAASNLAAILANGGYMPADPAAARVAGLASDGDYSNSVVTDAAALRPLTDIFAIPAGLPFANVFSVGDVLIGVGIGLAVSLGMHRTAPRASGPHAVHGGTSPD